MWVFRFLLVVTLALSLAGPALAQDETVPADDQPAADVAVEAAPDVTAEEAPAAPVPAKPPAAAATAAPCANAAPTPAGLTITSPAADLAPQIAAFAGTWEVGRAEGSAKLFVTQIDGSSASVIYSAIASQGTPPISIPTFVPFDATVLASSQLDMGDKAVQLTFTMGDDFSSIGGVVVPAGGAAIRFKMFPCTPPATVSAPPAAPPCAMQVPFQSGVTITPPSLGLPPLIAAFSGGWEGTWGYGAQSRMAVAQVNASSAVVYRGVGASQSGPGGSVPRQDATVTQGDKLAMVIGGGHYTFWIDNTLSAIYGVPDLDGAYRVRMTRCTL